MRIPSLTTIALATLAVAAGPANAQSGPVAVSPADMQPVAVEITISDAAGTALKTLSCEWTEPQDDDMQCIRFSSDPQVAFEAIEEAGGVRADKTLTTRGETATTSFTKRFDGTWLIRSRGTINGQPGHWGQVCTADGQSCRRWDAEGARFAQKQVRAAAAKLRDGKTSNAKGR